MTWPALKRPCTQEEFRQHVTGLTWSGWRPSLIVWHNTAAPTLAQWLSRDVAASLRNLENYYRNELGWSGGPHLFIDPDSICLFNPLNQRGVHSPSWNSTAIGIENVGDFDREDDDSGPGLKVKTNLIFATAVICEAVGLDPRQCIRLHKEDPRTTHDCPGKDLAQDKAAMIEAVVDLMTGGEHPKDATAIAVEAVPPPPKTGERRGVVTVDKLNLRSGPGVSNRETGSMPKGTPLVIFGEAKNGTTQWLRVRTPMGYEGWAAGKFIQSEEGRT